MAVIIQPRPLNVRKTIFVAAVLIALFVYTYFLREPPAPANAEIEGRTMGTTYTVRLVEAYLDQPAVLLLQGDIDELLEEMNRQMSTYLPDSEISVFNRSADTNAMTVATDFASVADFALDLAEASGGAFDPTVGPLIDLWGFGAPGRDTPPPSPDALADAMDAVGYAHVEVLLPDAIRKARPKVRISLDSVAKGYAVDQVAERLTDGGFTNYYVEVGGEVRVRGRGPTGGPWRIGIDYPDPSSVVGARFLAVLELRDCAVATSGDYRNFRRGPDGTRMAHFIDPRTGRPAAAPLASATIVADTCLHADGLATAVSLLGLEEGLALLDRYPGAEGLLVARDAEGRLVERETPGFAAYRAAE